MIHAVLAVLLAPPAGPVEVLSGQDPPASGPSGAESQPLEFDALVAIVNDQVLTRRQVQALAQDRAERFGQARRSAEEWYRLTLEDILVELLFQEGFKLEGDAALVDRIVEDEVQKRVDAAGSVAAMAAELEKMGLTLEDFRQGLRRQWMAILFQQTEQGLIPVAGGKGYKAESHFVRPSEIAAWYEEHREEFRHEHRVKARMITLQEEDGQPPAAERIQELRDRIQRGELTFAEAAARHSRYRPTTQGSMGFVNPDTAGVQAPIREFLKAAQPGQTSAPIEFSNGWALVLVEEVQPAGVAPLDDPEVQLKIRGRLLQDSREALLRDALRRLRLRCYIWGEEANAALDRLLGPPQEAAARERGAAAVPAGAGGRQ